MSEKNHLLQYVRDGIVMAEYDAFRTRLERRQDALTKQGATQFKFFVYTEKGWVADNGGHSKADAFASAMSTFRDEANEVGVDMQQASSDDSDDSDG